MRDCLSTAWWKFSNFGTPPTSAWAEKRRAGWPAKPYLAGELGAWVTADAAAALGSCCSPPPPPPPPFPPPGFLALGQLYAGALEFWGCKAFCWQCEQGMRGGA